MKITALRTEIFKEKDDLPAFIVRYVPRAAERTVLAVTSKLAALWKGSTLPFESETQKEILIKQQSRAALKTPLAWLTIKDGMVMTNAGIDQSNAEGKLLLLPDCYACAEELRSALKKAWGVKELGVVITDSMILPLRAGVIAGAVGYAGIKGVKDLRGQPDIFGKPLKTTLVNVADSLASAAALVMGEANEQCPLCIIEEAPVVFTQTVRREEMKYPTTDDLYAPLFKAAKLIE